MASSAWDWEDSPCYARSTLSWQCLQNAFEKAGPSFNFVNSLVAGCQHGSVPFPWCPDASRRRLRRRQSGIPRLLFFCGIWMCGA